MRRIIHRCIICRRFQGLAYNPPPLPMFWVKESPPFTYVGVDFAGPVIVKTDTVTQGNDNVWL